MKQELSDKIDVILTQCNFLCNRVRVFVEKNLFFKSILIALFEPNNLFKSVARKTFFCDVLNKCCRSDVDVSRKFV